MTATIVAIADAVVSELNGAQFSLPFMAQRSYLPRFDLAEMKDLHVTVVPKSVTVAPGDRARNQHDYEIDVAIQKKVAGDADIDAMMSLVNEIADHMRLKRLGRSPTAAWVRTEYEPIYSQEHLDQLGQFTSVLTFTFRVMR